MTFRSFLFVSAVMAIGVGCGMSEPRPTASNGGSVHADTPPPRDAFSAHKETIPVSADVSAADNADLVKQSLPRVIVEETEHDFDLMDPETEGEHVFVFKNVGSGPLKLADGGSTCKCTLADLPKHAIPPGEEVGIKVDWKTTLDGEFRQVATIRTNDPLKPNVRLAIQGLVRRQFGVFPRKMTFESVSLDDPDQGTLFVYSQVWDQFDVTNLRSDWEGLSWDVRPATDEDIQRIVPDGDVRSAYFVRVQLPDSARPGFFNHWLKMDAYGPTPDAKKTLEAKLVGRVLRRVCLYGKWIEPTGVLDGGILSEGKGTKMNLMMKVRDPVKDIKVLGIRTEPEFIKASVTPRNDGMAKGIYSLEVEIPRNAPACYHMGVNTGRLRLEIDHPRIKELDLGVKFCIVKR